MIRNFNDIESLRLFLRKDRESVSLNPIRFVNADSLQAWRDAKEILLSLSDRHVGLSEYCEGEDTTPNLRRLFAYLKADRGSVFVSPLSEYLRVKPKDARQIMTEILSREYDTDGKRRVYFLLYRMKSVLQTLPDSDPRKRDCMISLNAKEDADYSLTIIQKELKVRIPGNELNGFRRYLQYWERNPDKPLILYTENAIHLGEDAFFDQVQVITDAHDLLTRYWNLPGQFQKSDGSASEWNALLQAVKRDGDFQSACCAELNADSFRLSLFSSWNRLLAYQRWLLWLWARTRTDERYVTLCAKGSHSVAEFVGKLYCDIVDLLNAPSFPTVYGQRKGVLSKMRVSPPDAFWERERQLSDLDALRVLTDSGEAERNRILERMRKIAFGRHSNALEILRRSWPSLAYYLQDDDAAVALPEAYRAYFAEYRWLKATDTLTPHFMELVRRTAAQKGSGVYRMEARNKIVSDVYSKDDSAVFFVDGLGAEYLDYLAYVLAPLKHCGFSVTLYAGYCNLPSITETNKDFLTERHVAESLTEFDSLKHGSVRYPDTITRELEFLRTLREKIERCFHDGIQRVIVTSDHGASRPAVSVRKSGFDCKIPVPDNAVVCKYGRYCEGAESAEQLPSAIEVDEKIIFADYSRFEQKGAPVNEIHGGASLEEWLVPVIVVEKSVERKEPYHVRVVNPSVRLDSFTRMVTVTLEIKPYPPEDRKVSVQIRGKRIHCTAGSGFHTFRYKPADGETVVQAAVSIDDFRCQTQFSVIHGIMDNEKFQI